MLGRRDLGLDSQKSSDSEKRSKEMLTNKEKKKYALYISESEVLIWGEKIKKLYRSSGVAVFRLLAENEGKPISLTELKQFPVGAKELTR